MTQGLKIPLSPCHLGFKAFCIVSIKLSGIGQKELKNLIRKKIGMLSSLRDLLSRKKEEEKDIFTEASISSKLY